MNTRAKPSESGKNRIKALSGGIFAIVMTLLWLNILILIGWTPHF